MWKSIPTSSSSKKRKMQKHNIEDSIPMDLTIEILKKLPVKSLLKFQYVSKTWCSIIRSKDFINSSISMSSSSSSSKLLIAFKNGNLTNKNVEKRLFFFTTSQKENEIANLEMTMSSIDAYFNTRCASLNGFICVSHKSRFMICNPSTKQVITLPEIAGKSTNKYLGYDPVNDQYKAMCKKISNSEDDQEHMVLTLGDDKTWRRIDGTNPNYYPLTKGISINGFVYYGACTPNTHGVIVRFDVSLEKLSFINLPSPLRHKITWNDSTSTLINYKSNLAYVNLHSNENFHVLDLWVLEDVKEHSWSMKTCYFSKFRWSSLGDSIIPMSIQGTNKFDEIIIAPKFLPCDFGVFRILYYDVESNNVKRVEILGVGDDEGFRRRYGIGDNGNCNVYISPDYGENITFL